jgi:hypothetical protein
MRRPENGFLLGGQVDDPKMTFFENTVFNPLPSPAGCPQ